jgi:putative DNA primase/helicase
MVREAMELGDPDKAQKLRAWSKTSESRAKLESMVKLAEAQPPLVVTTADLDQGSMVLNTQTGTIDLRTGDCRPHQPSDLLTMIARTGYDPDATCPRFDDFLLQIFEGDVELIEYVMRILSMCLTGDIREQILPIFHGPGANGKSVLIDTVLHVMGDYAGLAPPHLLEQRQHQEHPTELADLRGKRLVVASELDDDAKLKLSLVKRLTGDHTIKGRKMRQDYIEFPRTHKIILVTNNLPTFSEQTEAVWRRVRVIPFNYIVPEDRRDPKLLEALKAEAPGILRRLVHACRDWQQHGLGRSSAVDLATAAYRTEQDEIGWYIGGFCEVDPNAFTPWDEVWSHYERCCRNQCVEPLAKAAFQMALTRAGWGTVTQKVEGHSRKGRRIRLKS